MTPLRIAFMGSPDFAVPTLEALLGAGHEVICVYSQPPKPAGRGRQIQRTPVHVRADALGLPVRTPTSLKADADREAFAALALDAAVVIAYGLILPKAVLEAPRLGCMNLHASLLPRWRGAAPIQRAIMAGDAETGVQAMVMEPGLDTGPVLATRHCAIAPDDTAGTLHDRLAGLAADLAPKALADWAAGHVRPTPQAEAGVTYAQKITAEDRPIDWTHSAAEIDARIRGLAPIPGATFRWIPEGGAPVLVKALMSAVADRPPGAGDARPGTLLDSTCTVACGDGTAVRLIEVQRPGKRPVDGATFARGAGLPPGTVFG